jgi:alkylation response protein AidB-like acyl-CoA dehydrogenase
MLENGKQSVSDRLGQEGKVRVINIVLKFLNEGHIGIVAQQIGIAKGCLDIATTDWELSKHAASIRKLRE